MSFLHLARLRVQFRAEMIHTNHVAVRSSDRAQRARKNIRFEESTIYKFSKDMMPNCAVELTVAKRGLRFPPTLRFVGCSSRRAFGVLKAGFMSREENFLLSFELNVDGRELVVHGDVVGLELLVERIGRLIRHTKEGEFEHSHLMTPAWGGAELSEESQGGEVVHHVRLVCWKRNSSQG